METAESYGRAFTRSRLGAPNETILSAARMPRDPDNYDKVSGVLMIDVRQDIVSTILSELQFAPGTAVYLVAEDGAIVYHPDAALIGTAVEPHILDALNEGRKEQSRFC